MKRVTFKQHEDATGKVTYLCKKTLNLSTFVVGKEYTPEQIREYINNPHVDVVIK